MLMVPQITKGIDLPQYFVLVFCVYAVAGAWTGGTAPRFFIILK